MHSSKMQRHIDKIRTPDEEMQDFAIGSLYQIIIRWRIFDIGPTVLAASIASALDYSR